jgi:hypothetical protein
MIIIVHLPTNRSLAEAYVGRSLIGNHSCMLHWRRYAQRSVHLHGRCGASEAPRRLNRRIAYCYGWSPPNRLSRSESTTPHDCRSGIVAMGPEILRSSGDVLPSGYLQQEVSDQSVDSVFVVI